MNIPEINEIPEIDFSERFPDIIGRNDQLSMLYKALKDQSGHYILITAPGGYGKTRLLEAADKLVETIGEGYHSSGIIDLYHTWTHGASDIEKTIADRLDPMEKDQFPKGKFFIKFREERQKFELLRERGANPEEIEHRRAELSNIFISELRNMAAEEKKLLICFDTIEQIQYESTSIEEEIGMDQVDPRIRGWLLDKLPRMGNVLVVMAGRPKAGPFQQRLVNDLNTALSSHGAKLEITELNPFEVEDTCRFFEKLPNGSEYIEEVRKKNYFEILYLLTGGRPIMLHLVYDLISFLAYGMEEVYTLFDRYESLRPLFKETSLAQEASSELRAARKEFFQDIGRLIINRTHMGKYLEIIALLPKGVNTEILATIGVRGAILSDLLNEFQRLSFVKVPKAGAEGLLVEKRIFFHEEMYDLMTDPSVTGDISRNKPMIASSVVNGYYNPKIAQLEKQIQSADSVELRVLLRAEQQKLQVERLYYILAQDVSLGYEEYKRLTARACAERWVGYTMRLLDEFLRYYNPDTHRAWFASAGITHAQVKRESAQLWMERFHWGGNYKAVIEFAKKIFENPGRLEIRPTDLDILGNIRALWARAYTMLYGFDEDVLVATLEMLDQMPPMEKCTPNELLARARLATSVGYTARWGGYFDLAESINNTALNCYRELDQYPEEKAIVYGNMAYVYAKRGQIMEGRSFGQQALDMNRELGSRYSEGLSNTILAAIERMASTNFNKAIDYSEAALTIFQDIGDYHGLVKSYLNRGSARREIAEEEILDGKVEKALHTLEEALLDLNQGFTQANEGKLESEKPGLNAEIGKVHRAMGRAYKLLKKTNESELALQDAIKEFENALEWSRWSDIERCDMMEDIAETYYEGGKTDIALEQLEKMQCALNSIAKEGVGALNSISKEGMNVKNWYYLPYAKAERLRGHIAMLEKEPHAAIVHFITAAAFFSKFSSDAVEKSAMLQRINQRYLSKLPYSELKDMISYAETWISQHNGLIDSMDVRGFLVSLKRLVVM